MLTTNKSCSCYHCGLPVADPHRWTILIRHIEHPMCCPGCQTVAGAIVAGGLENYYQYRSELAVKGDEHWPNDNAGFLVFDDPALQQTFVTSTKDANQVEIQLYIEGIHCAACCWLIEHALQKKAGVKSISVSLATRKAFLCWDVQQQKLSELLQCIHAVGYRAKPYQPLLVEQSMAKENRQQLLRLGVAGIGMMQAMMFAIALYSGDFSGIDNEHKQFMRLFALIVTIPVMFYSATPFFTSAWRNLKSFHAGMDLPISLALLIAFAASLQAVLLQQGEVYFDSISMFVFLLLLARFIESRARQRFLDLPLASLLPISCECLRDAAYPTEFKMVAVNQVKAGDVIRVKAGETIPLDATVMDGCTSVNEGAFSGEHNPVTKKTGDAVFAGTINGDGVLVLHVTSTSGHTRMDMITRLSEWSLSQKPRVSVMADQLAAVFTVLVLLLAAGTGIYWYHQNSVHAFAIVLSVLVVSCPCALSLATPSALACCYQALRKQGMLINSKDVIEQCRNISCVIFDKTGTLTLGNFSIRKTYVLSAIAEENVLELSAAMEKYSEHPIASAFKNIATDITLSGVGITSGKGVEASWQHETYRIGSREFCAELSASPAPVFAGFDGLAEVYLAKSGQWLACYHLADEVRPEAQELIRQLQQSGRRVEILSGDSSGAAENLAQQLGVQICYSAMSPEAKLNYINLLQAQGQRVLMVGDGINDIPVLARANVSIAMNNASDLAKVKADAILLSDQLQPVLDLLRHSEKTRRVILQNITWALLYNGLALPLAAMGWVTPWQAALGMSFSSLWVTFNSLRLRNI